MERLLKNARDPEGNCLASKISDDAKASFTVGLCPPGRLTKTVATAAKPSSKKRNHHTIKQKQFYQNLACRFHCNRPQIIMSRFFRFHSWPQIQRNRSKWTFGHMQHLNNVSATCTSHIGCLFGLPANHTSRQEEEETGEED